MRLAWVLDNWRLKLFSLAVSVLMFFFVGMDSSTPVLVDFRIEYQLPDELVLVGDPPDVMHATLQGPWASLRSYDSMKLKSVVVDLRDAGPGRLRRSLETVDVTPPTGMLVMSIRPAELVLDIDRQVERTVPVQIDLKGRPEFGYEVQATSTTPARVKVRGPAIWR